MTNNINVQRPRFAIREALCFILLLFISVSSLAEGSKDLYPAGAKGGRAFLLSTTNANGANPFPTLGNQFVYVKAGEWISMASSMQGLEGSTDKRIILFDPDGNQIALSFSGGGNIPNRAAELAGPAFPGQSPSGDQYTAIYYQATMTGIYKVQFFADVSNKSTSKGNYGANEDWVQTDNNRAIAAWDVSVCDENKTSWTHGRVYMYVVNLVINSAGTKDYKGGFYGDFKILTNDGYVYNVNNNGMNGIYFTFMVNNRGFHEPGDPGSPLYKSINGTSLSDIQDRYHDPRTPDIPTTSTDKIFYNLPDGNMPETALGGQDPGKDTWMRPTPKILKVSNISFTGAEGTPDQMGQGKGGYITFNSSISGSYKLEIEPTGSASFTPRVLIGGAVQGQNKVYFDGKDGDGNPIPIGTVTLKIAMEVRFAEVHFPFIDVEVNPYGIIIELLKNDFSGVASDIVYWDDKDIPEVNESKYGPMTTPVTNLNGISSNTNGHKWGSDDPQYKTGGTFGDKMGMDTWTYLQATTNPSVTVKVKRADLKIADITAGKATVEAGDDVTYIVKAGNGGPSEVTGSKFTFTLPQGFENVGNATFNSNGCGTESSLITYDASTRTYTSYLNLSEGCTVSYTIKTKVTGNASPGDQEAEATILRTNDISDPDATNMALKDENNNTYHPTDAHQECSGNSSGGSCNNIMTRKVEVVVMYAVQDINQISEGEAVDGNVLTNDVGNGLTVVLAASLDQNGNAQQLQLGTATPVYNKSHQLTGKITLNTNGSYSFTPQNGFTGNVPVAYTIKDKNGSTDETSLDIKVEPITNPVKNDKPIALNDIAYTQKGIAVSSNVLNNDHDPDKDNLSVTAAAQGNKTITPGTAVQVSGTDTSGSFVSNAGVLVVNANGSYTFTPAPAFVGSINAITYKITDSHGGSDSGTLSVAVLKYTFNQTFANDDANTAPKGNDMTGNVLDNDTDPEDDGQTVTSATADAGGTGVAITIGGETTVSGVGKITLNKDGSYTFKPQSDFVGTLSVEYTINDNEKTLAGSKATLYLTSLDVLTPPKANDDEKKGQLLFTKVTIPVIDNDAPGNSDPIDSATVSLTGPSGSISNDINHDGKIDKVTVPNEGVWTVDAKGNVTFIPAAGFAKDPTPIKYTIEGGAGLVSNEAAITITYNRTPPTAVDDSANGGTPGQQVSLYPTNNDIDNNGTGIAPATVNLTGPSGSTPGDINNDGNIDQITVQGEGIWTVDATGKVTFIPDPGFWGDPTPIKYIVKDSAKFKSNEAKISITYNHIPPTANDDNKGDVVSGTSVTIPVIANDKPGNSGSINPSSISLIGQPGSTTEDTNNDGKIDQITIPNKGGWKTDQSGNVTFIPDPGFMGDPPPIEYTVEDEGGGVSNAATITIKTRLGDNCFIPNNFTPNHDGLNDKWKIYGNNIQDVYVMVYNQYGQKIFESRDKNIGWDGRYKGVLQPAGVYVYYAKITFYDGTTSLRKGSITLIR